MPQDPATTVTLNAVMDAKPTKANVLSKKTVINKWCSLWWKAILAEFLSTCLLVLLGCMTCILPSPNNSNVAMYESLGFGFVVMFNIQIFGHISGAYMNPSVTLAAVLWGNIPLSVGIVYIIVECIGAIAGYGILVSLAPLDIAAGGICATQPIESLSVIQGVFIEIVLTSTLNFLNCGVWDPVNKAKQDSTAIKFGLAIAGLSFAGGPLTGCSMNPARSLGPAVFTSVWRQHWIYWVGPFIGAILPVVIYKYLLMKGVPKDLN